MRKTRFLVSVSIMFACLLVAACGSGGSSVAGGGIGGTGITASGAITGFGSIKLNGIEFDTTNATRLVDGVSAADDTALAVGMVVTVKGTLADDGISGTADQIVYDDDVQGPIQGPIDTVDQTKTFSVMGIQVEVNKISTIFENTDYDALFVSQLVEISGFYDGTGILHATRIEDKGGNLVEVKGKVTAFGPGPTFTLAVVNGAISYTVDWTAIINSPALGDLIEVKGTLAGTTITATQIEPADEGFEDIDKASIEGIVSGFAAGGIGDFQVAGQKVDATGASFSPTGLAMSLADGMQVEIDGPIINGVLQALKVEARGGEVEIGATLESVIINTGGTTGSLTLQLFPNTLDVLVDSRTTLRDDTGAANPLTLAALVPMNDYLEVEAYLDNASGDLIATEIRRDSVDNDLLQGPADSCDGVTVSIFGIEYVLDDNITSYQDENEASIGTATAFCTQWSTGGFLIKVVDKLSGGGPDGIADEAELEGE